MIVRGKRPDGGFYVLDKRISEDARLSWAARGLLVYLLGKPDHWQVSPAALVNETRSSAKPTGRDGVYSMLGELARAGYLQRTQARNPDGTVGPVQYIVSESPLTAEPDTAQPDTAQPLPANPTQVNTDYKQRLKEQARTDGGAADGATAKPAGPRFDRESWRIVGLPAELLDKWRASFPGLNVSAEITRAECWLLANPKRAKKDYVRFLGNWLTSAFADLKNGRGSRVSAPTKDQHRDNFGAFLHGQQQPTTGQGGGDVIDVVATQVH